MEVGRVGVEGCVEYVAEVRWLEAGVEEEYIASLMTVLNTKISSQSLAPDDSVKHENQYYSFLRDSKGAYVFYHVLFKPQKAIIVG